MGIISRESWGAAHDDGFGAAPLPAEEMWLHHSVAIMPDVEWVDRDRDGVDDSEAAAMRQLEQIGEQRFGRGISYTHGVVPAGRIYEGHGVDRQGAHTKGRNDRARAIVWLGNFDLHKPTTAMIRATAWLLQEYVRRGWLRHARLNGGHQQAPGAATACPGKHAMAAIPEINRLAAGPPITLEDDDMELTDRFDHSKIRLQPGTVGHAMLGTWQFAQGARIAAEKNTGELAGLRAAVSKLAEAVAGEPLTAAQLKAAVKDGVAEGLAEGVVEVDVDLTIGGKAVTGE